MATGDKVVSTAHGSFAPIQTIMALFVQIMQKLEKYFRRIHAERITCDTWPFEQSKIVFNSPRTILRRAITQYAIRHDVGAVNVKAAAADWFKIIHFILKIVVYFSDVHRQCCQRMSIVKLMPNASSKRVGVYRFALKY